MKRFRWWLWGLIPLALFAVLIWALFGGLGRNPRFIPSPLVGKPAPAFSLPSLYHPDQRISNADIRGRVVLVNVFASWCVACTEEAPVLDYLHRNGVAIYGLDYSDTRSAAKAWLKRYGNPYRAIAFDPRGEQALNWGIWGVPETFVIDRNGIIVRKFTGIITLEMAKTRVLPLVHKLEKEK